MKRLILGLVFGSFLALVGIHTCHVHSDANVEACRICVIGDQAVRVAPAAPAALVVSVVAAALQDAPQGDVCALLPVRVAARAPPSA